MSVNYLHADVTSVMISGTHRDMGWCILSTEWHNFSGEYVETTWHTQGAFSNSSDEYIILDMAIDSLIDTLPDEINTSTVTLSVNKIINKIKDNKKYFDSFKNSVTLYKSKMKDIIEAENNINKNEAEIPF